MLWFPAGFENSKPALSHLLSARVSRFQSVPDFHGKKGWNEKKTTPNLCPPNLLSPLKTLHTTFWLSITGLCVGHSRWFLCCFKPNRSQEQGFSKCVLRTQLLPWVLLPETPLPGSEINTGFLSSPGVPAYISVCILSLQALSFIIYHLRDK